MSWNHLSYLSTQSKIQINTRGFLVMLKDWTEIHKLLLWDTEVTPVVFPMVPTDTLNSPFLLGWGQQQQLTHYPCSWNPWRECGCSVTKGMNILRKMVIKLPAKIITQKYKNEREGQLWPERFSWRFLSLLTFFFLALMFGKEHKKIIQYLIFLLEWRESM